MGFECWDSFKIRAICLVYFLPWMLSPHVGPQIKGLTRLSFHRALPRWRGGCRGWGRLCHAGSRPRCAAHYPHWAWRCVGCESPPADASGPVRFVLCWPVCLFPNRCWTCEEEMWQHLRLFSIHFLCYLAEQNLTTRRNMLTFLDKTKNDNFSIGISS